MKFPRDFYDCKLECSGGTIDAHLYLLKALSRYFVGSVNTQLSPKYTEDGKLIIKTDCDMIVMQSILDILYYGWQSGVTITVDICKEIINTCHFLDIGEDLVKIIMTKLLDINLYEKENLGDVYDIIATGYPAILRMEIFLGYRQYFSKNIFRMALAEAKKDLEPYKLIIHNLSADLTSEELYTVFMEDHILFDILLRCRDEKLAGYIIKNLQSRDDIIYVYNVMIDSLKSYHRKADLFKALADKLDFHNDYCMYSICSSLGKY